MVKVEGRKHARDGFYCTILLLWRRRHEYHFWLTNVYGAEEGGGQRRLQNTGEDVTDGLIRAWETPIARMRL